MRRRVVHLLLELLRLLHPRCAFKLAHIVDRLDFCVIAADRELLFIARSGWATRGPILAGVGIVWPWWRAFPDFATDALEELVSYESPFLGCGEVIEALWLVRLGPGVFVGDAAGSGCCKAAMADKGR